MTSSGQFPGEFQAGDIVGGTYLVLDYIGRGSMGHLYHVRHTMLNTQYALKTLSSDKVTELDWKRFQIEAQATATMQHPNVVSVHNFGLHDSILPFYVMELLQGVDLGERERASGALAVKEAVAVFIEVCAGIGYAHKKGIIHRDIKPGNIFLLEAPDPTGAKVKVVDFGIAKLAVTKDQETQSLTAVGDVVGTPFYMSPEQCMGLRVDARSDIYSLGCTLFEALTGSLPFAAGNPTEVMLLHQSAQPPSLNKASAGKNFPDSLEYIIATTLAKEPSERYQTMDLLARDLAAVIENNRPIEATPGGATTFTVEAVPTLLGSTVAGIENIQNKRLVPIVSALVAGLLAMSFYGYWQSRHMVKMPHQLSMTDQLQKLPGADLSGKTAAEEAAENTDFEKETKALEKANLAVALAGNKPFSTIRQVDGKSMRCFNFPKDPVIGRIRDWYSQAWVMAAGQVQFPEETWLTFSPSAVVGRVPDCLKRFRRHEIYCIEFAPGADSLAVLTAALNLEDLQELDLTNCKLPPKLPLDIFKQFQSLEWFVGPISETDASVLAQAECWGNMKAFFLPSAKNVLPILKALQTSKRLERLGIGPSHLTDKEYRVIATMSKLWYLDIHGNPLTSNDLKLLSTLHEMNTLNLVNSDVDLSALATLKQFEKLKKLYISSPKLSQDDFQKISKALPKVTVRQTMYDQAPIYRSLERLVQSGHKAK